MKSYLSFVLCLVAAVMVGASSAQATLLFYDGFDYTPTNNIDGVGGWIDPTGVVGVSSVGLTYTGLATEGGAAKKKLPQTNNIGSNGNSQAHQIVAGLADQFKSESNVFYVSWLAGDSTGSPTSMARRGNIAIFNHDGAGTPFQDGLSTGTTGGMGIQVLDVGVVGEGNANPGDAAGTKMLLGRITMKVGDDEFAGILNPDLATVVDSDFNSAETAYGEISASASQNIEWLGLWIGTWGVTDDGDNTLMDEIRIGTTLADVIPVPEPASLALLAVGGLALLRRRCR